MTSSGYRWYHTCAPGPDHHEGSLRKAFCQPRRMVSDATVTLVRMRAER